MTATDISFKLGVCPETVRRWIRSGKLIADAWNNVTPANLAEFLKAHPKYEVLCKGVVADIDVRLISLEQRLEALEELSLSLKRQQDFVQSEVTALKADINNLKKKEFTRNLADKL